MSNFPRFIDAAVVVVLLALSSNALSQPVNGGSDAEQQAKKLAKLLRKRGYVEVPLTLDKTGVPLLKVEADGAPMLLILDTGANNINLDRTSAKRAKLTVKETEEKTSALGGTVKTAVTKIGQVSVGGLTDSAEAYVVDLSSINAARKERGDPPCDGILGVNFLKDYSAVIVCEGQKLYLLDAAQPAKSLAKVLKKGRYVEVPLALNKTGLLDVKVEVDGMPMLLFLDTGYNTFISLDRASTRRAKLTVKETDGKSSALGGAVGIGQTKIDRLSVGGLTMVTDAQVVDFSPTNATRKARGDRPCDGILGGSFLRHYSALMDFGHLKLYLLDPAEK